jgi:hypothetical protein
MNKNRKQRGFEKDQVAFPLPEVLKNMPEGYLGFIKQIKEQIINKRLETIIAANSAMIIMYWEIGNAILHRQKMKDGVQK